MPEIPAIIEPIGGFALSLLLALVIIPTIITIVREKNLFDEPNERTSHAFKTPTLGGVGVYLSIMISVPLLTASVLWDDIRFLFVAMTIMFAVGIKDDILAISPMKKMMGQIAAAGVLVLFADVRVSNLHGFYGIHELNYYVSVAFSVFVFIVIINAFNFIDGIDGLAASIGIIDAFAFGVWFFLRGEIGLSTIALSLAGGLVGFFYYNVYSKKFKIFMGDTGSLLIGLMMTFFAIHFNEMNIDTSLPYAVHSTPSVTFAIMALPLFDFFRIIFVRTVLKKSLSSPDRLHLHHRVIRLGMPHRVATYWLAGGNLLFVFFGFYFHFISIRRLLLIELLLAMCLAYLPVLIYDIKRKRKLLKYTTHD